MGVKVQDAVVALSMTIGSKNRTQVVCDHIQTLYTDVSAFIHRRLHELNYNKSHLHNSPKNCMSILNVSVINTFYISNQYWFWPISKLTL